MILKWKLGDDFNNHKDKKVSELQALFVQNEAIIPPDSLLPPAPQEPSVPNIDETELGYTRRQQFYMMLQTSHEYNNSQLQQLATVLLGICTDHVLEMSPV